MYWKNNPDVRNDAVSSAMRYLHLTDNTQVDRRDKFAKVRPACAWTQLHILVTAEVVH